MKTTNDYQAKQTIARKIEGYAKVSRWNNNSYFDIAFEGLGRFIASMMNIDGFAAQVAKTIDATMSPYNNTVARVSSKQAWILACAAVENEIEF